MGVQDPRLSSRLRLGRSNKATFGGSNPARPPVRPRDPGAPRVERVPGLASTGRCGSSRRLMVFYAIFLVGSGGTLLEKDAVLAFSAVPGTSESDFV